ADVTRLQEQVNSLRNVVASLVVLVIMISGAFNVYLLRELRYARSDAAALNKVVTEYNETNLPVFKEFRNRLYEYSRAHPEFAPIANKYGLNNPPPGAVPTAAQKPAPVAPPKK